MLDGLTAWLLLAFGFFVPGVAIALLIWINIHTRRKNRNREQ